jgi:hypothetical protein
MENRNKQGELLGLNLSFQLCARQLTYQTRPIRGILFGMKALRDDPRLSNESRDIVEREIQNLTNLLNRLEVCSLHWRGLINCDGIK